MDSREDNACDECQDLDGEIFDEMPEHPHPNCNCDISKYTDEDDEDKERSKNPKEQKRRQRHQNKKKIDKAAKYLKEKIKFDDKGRPKSEYKSIGKCAKYVREAVEHGTGQKVDIPAERYKGHGASAADYGSSYEKIGFKHQYMSTVMIKKVKNGHIIIIQPTKDGLHKDGHIAMHDGKQWVSNCKQNTTHGLRGQKLENLDYTIYSKYD